MTGNVKREEPSRSVPIVQSRAINGIDEKTYERILAKVGRPVRSRRLIDVHLAYKMKKSGFSLEQIGKYFDVSGCTIKRRLKSAGLF
jgi:hypothetical protein